MNGTNLLFGIKEAIGFSRPRDKIFSSIIQDALAEKPRERKELKKICRTHGMSAAEEKSMFDPWGGGIRELAERGFVYYSAEEKR